MKTQATHTATNTERYLANYRSRRELQAAYDRALKAEAAAFGTNKYTEAVKTTDKARAALEAA